MGVQTRAFVVATLTLVAASARPDELVVWNPTREDASALEKVAAAYNAKRGRVQPHVVVQQYAFDGFADRISATVPTGRGPDVFIYPQDRLGGWIEAGNMVEPIEGFVNPTLKARFIPAALEAMTYRRVLYGLPLGFKTVTLVYNRKLVKTPPRTTAELATLAMQLTHRASDTYGLVYRYADYYFHAALQNGFGGHVFDRDLLPLLDSPENLKAMQLMLKWKRDFLPEDPPTRERVESLFNQGKAAMVFEGPWFTAHIAREITYGVAPLPILSEAGGKPMRPWMTVAGLYISARSEHKAAAYDFLSYATDVAAERIIATEGVEAPANQKVYIDGELLANEALAVYFQQARVAVPMPNAPEMTAMWTPATTALFSVVRGAATPEAALAKAQAQVKQGVSSLHDPRPPPK